MKKVVKLDRIIGSDTEGEELVALRVVMDKEYFNYLVRGYKEMWSKLKLGDECAPLNFVRMTLKEIERGCSK